MAEITFHSMPDSAYLWTAMMVAAEKGLAYAFEPLEYGSAEHLKLHPFGKMPVFQHGEVFLYETLAIAHYIDRAFDGPPLQPASPLGQAQMLRWVGVVNAYVFPVMNRFMKERLVRPAFGFDPDADFLAGAEAPLRVQLRVIDEALQAAAYLCGDRLTIADCFLLPHLLFFSLTPEGAALIAERPGLAGWLARLQGRPSYQSSPMSQTFGRFS